MTNLKPAVAGAAFLALCANISSWAVDFPSASGDISSASDWGGTLPSTTDPVRFKTDNGVYTATNDVQFAAMTVTAANVTFNMGVAAGEDPRLLKFKSFMAPSKDQSILLNGGIWDFQGGNFSCCDRNTNRKSSNQLITLDGGAIVTNIGSFRMSYRDNYNALRLVNGSKMYFSKCDWDYGEGKSNAVEVLSGSELVASSYIRDSYYKSSDGTYTCTRFLVSGTGSKIRLTGTVSTSGWLDFSLGSVYAGGSLTVADNALVESALDFVMGKGTAGHETRATVRSGGTMTLAGNAVVGSAESTFGHVLAVSNATSAISLEGDFKIGSGKNAHGNSVIISDQGAVSCVKMYVGGGSGSCSNTLAVTDNGTLALSSEWYVGKEAGSHDNTVTVSGGGRITGLAVRMADSTTAYNNRLILTDGGKLTASGLVHLGGYSSAGTAGGHNNSLYVSNATLKCTRLNFGMAPSAVSNTVFIAGSETSFTSTYTGILYLFGVGGWHEMTLADGAVWSHHTSIYTDDNAFSNRLVVTRGAKFSIGGTGNFISGIGELSCANRVEVSDGASLRAGNNIYVTHRDNVVAVSNATISAGGRLYVGNQVEGDLADYICGNRFEICGTNPVVSVGTTFGIYRDSTLLFNLPEEGYAGNAAPVQASNASISASATLAIEGIAEMRRCSKRTSSRIALIHTAAGVTVPSATIDAVNASFAAAGAPDCRIYVSDDGKDLMLKVPLCKGCVFCIR